MQKTPASGSNQEPQKDAIHGRYVLLEPAPDRSRGILASNDQISRKVDLNIVEGYVFVDKRNPGALCKWAVPSGIQFHNNHIQNWSDGEKFPSHGQVRKWFGLSTETYEANARDNI